MAKSNFSYHDPRILLLLAAIIFVILVIVLNYRQPQPSSQAPLSMPPSAENTFTPPLVPAPSPVAFASPNQQTTITFTPKERVKDTNEFNCELSITNQQQTLTVSSFSSSTRCQVSDLSGELLTIFAGWKSDNLFLLEREPGYLELIQVPELTITNFRFDPQYENFYATDDSGQYWVLENLQTHQLILYNSQHQSISMPYNLNLNDSRHLTDVLYDSSNSGFLFILRQDFPPSKPSGIQYTTTELHYLSLSGKATQMLLQTEPTVLIGRDCGPAKLTSQNKQLTITPGCFVVPEKLLNAQGQISITLK